MKYTTIVLAVVVGCAVAVVPAQQPTVLKSIECTICELFEPEFAALAKEDKNVVEAKLNSICAEIPFGTIAKGCKTFLDEEIDNIVAALAKDPATVCTQIHACTAAVVEVAVPVVSRAARVQQAAFDPKCLLCHMLGPELEKLAGKEEPVIQKELDTICERVLGWEHEFAEDCVNFINKEGAMIAKVLAEDNGSGAKELCEKIGWCPSSLFEAKITNLENPLECDICKAVGPELEKLAGQKEPVVVKDLEIVCSKLSIFKAPCDNWVEKEGAMIAKVLTEDEGSSAHVLCQKLHMCESALVEAAATKSDIKCFICHELGPELERLAKKEEGVVAGDLEHICDKIPLVGKECDDFIKKEATMIAKVLTEDSGSKAHVLCEKIGWC